MCWPNSPTPGTPRITVPHTNNKAGRKKPAKSQKLANDRKALVLSSALIRTIHDSLTNTLMPTEVRTHLLGALLQGGGFIGGGSGPATVRLRLPIAPQVVSSNGVGQVQVVYGIQYTSVVGLSDWANVFKEYRFIKATVHFTPCGVPLLSAADASFGAGINYSTNITAPGSLAECLSLDNGQVVGSYGKQYTWECRFVKTGTEVWTDMGTNVVYATWKAFNTATGNPLSVQLGNWWGFVDLEMRGFG